MFANTKHETRTMIYKKHFKCNIANGIFGLNLKLKIYKTTLQELFIKLFNELKTTSLY